uniref:Uncharacterized protein n=1 Tax=Cucumis sativus TaxID=3659 RepID=A0A0A0KHL1_CUCSA
MGLWAVKRRKAAGDEEVVANLPRGLEERSVAAASEEMEWREKPGTGSCLDTGDINLGIFSWLQSTANVS